METLSLTIFIYVLVFLLLLALTTIFLKRVLKIDSILESQKEQICLLKQIRDQEAAMFNKYFKNDYKSN